MKKTKVLGLLSCLLAVIWISLAYGDEQVDEQLFYLKNYQVYSYNRSDQHKQKLASYEMGPGKGDPMTPWYEPGSGFARIPEWLLTMANQIFDNQYLVYLSDYNSANQSGTLNIRNLKDNQESFVLDQNVMSYGSYQDGTITYYKVKDPDNYNGSVYRTLHTYNFNTQETVTCTIPLEESSSYGTLLKISADNPSHALWQEYGAGGQLQLFTVDLNQPDGNKTPKIANLDDEARFDYISEDFQTIHFQLEKDVYRISGLNTTKKIASNVDRVYPVGNSGNFYFTTNSRHYQVSDFLDDDMKKHDQSMTVPDDSADQETIDKYEQKLMRDWLRDPADFYVGIGSTSELHYFNGTKSKKVIDQVYDIKIVNDADDLAIICNPQWHTLFHSIKISQVESYGDIQNQIVASRPAVAQYSLVIGDKVIPLPSKSKSFDLDIIAVDTEHQLLYYVNNIEDSQALYEVSYAQGKLATPRIVDAEPQTDYYILPETGNQIFYTKSSSLDEYAADTVPIFTNGALIDQDVVDYLWHDNTFYYFKNLDQDNRTADLYRYQDNQTELIGAKVRSFLPLDDGSIAYLADFNQLKGHGTLFLRNATGQTKVVDYETAALKGSLLGHYVTEDGF